MKDNPKEMKPPTDLQQVCDDLKVCGKRELYNLLKLRHKYQVLLGKEAKERKDEERKARLEAEGPREKESEEAKLDRELEETITRIEKDKKRQGKKDREQAVKADLRTKMSVIATTTIDNDEELYLNANQWDLMRKKVDNVEKDSDDDELDSIEEEDSDDENDSENEGAAEKDSDEESVDSGAAQVNEMADEFEEQITMQNEYAMNIDRKEAKRLYKKKALVDQQRLRLEDVSEEEDLDNAELMEDGDKHKVVPAGKDAESSGDDSEGGIFVNPLSKLKTDKKEKEKDSEDEWSDTGSALAEGLDQRGKKKKTAKDAVLGKRKRKGAVENIKDFFTNEAIEEVPLDDPETRQ